MENWNQLREQNSNLIYKRQFLYWAFIGITLALIIFSLILWSCPSLSSEIKAETWTNKPFFKSVLPHIADIMRYALPDMFNGFIDFVALKKPQYLLLLLIIILVFKSRRKKLQNGQEDARRQMRKLVVKKWLTLKEEGQVKG